MASVSIGKLFFGGIIPGTITALFLAVAVFFESRRLPYMKPDLDSSKSTHFWFGVIGLGAPILILGSIYFGFLTPTESAAVANLYIILVGAAIYRSLSAGKIWEVLKRASSLTAAIMLLTASGALYAWVITRLRIADQVIGLLGALVDKPLPLIFSLNGIILAAGCFIEPIPLIYMTVPIFVPLLERVGIDLVYFGVIYTINLAIAQVTPPVGANLFVGAGVLKMPYEEVVKGLPLLLLALSVSLLVTILVPEFTLFIPKLLFK